MSTTMLDRLTRGPSLCYGSTGWFQSYVRAQTRRASSVRRLIHLIAEGCIHERVEGHSLYRHSGRSVRARIDAQRPPCLRGILEHYRQTSWEPDGVEWRYGWRRHVGTDVYSLFDALPVRRRWWRLDLHVDGGIDLLAGGQVGSFQRE